jgi:hypothetical protein
MELQVFITENQDYINLFKNEGLKVIKYRDLIIVKNYYDKPLTFGGDNDYWKMYCRGAIIDTIKNKVICLPPTKSILTDMDYTFVDGETQCLVDGTMINLFYTNEQWLLATRSEIGGHNKWINKKSFKKMFEECCDIDMNLLDKDCSYSFVMRHKENRNVSPVKENEVYLVEVYKFNLDSPSKVIERLTLDQYPSNIQKINTVCTSPPCDMESMLNNYEIKGFTIKKGNRRYKIVNPEFERVKNLKVNMNNELLNYIELRKNGNLKEYLKYFPEHSKLFDNYRGKIHNLSNELYSNYKDCFIFKKKDKKELPYHLKPFVNEIHKNYLKNKKPTTWQDIKDYIHGLPPKRLVFALNYSV